LGLSFYFTKTPEILKPLSSELIWNFPDDKTPTIYLTFDDGPVKGITDVVLGMLKKYNAKATFFCVGENVVKYPKLYNKIIKEGHSVANHTYNHLSGWKETKYKYYKNVLKAKNVIDSDLFRPPYGRISPQQIKSLRNRFRIVMWDVLSGDFDPELNPEDCANNVIKSTKQGSIIVFHDSLKAKKNILESLPIVLKHFSNKGFEFSKID